MKSVLETAKELAKAHKEEDPETIAIYLAEAENEVRLVEVTHSVESSAPAEVLPFRFAAQPEEGFDYPSVIVLLSPSEWAKVEKGELQLPAGWDLKQLRRLS